MPYYRRRRSYTHGPRKGLITVILMLVNIVIFFYTADLVFGIGDQWVYDFAQQKMAILDNGEWWRLITAMFLHANIYHLLGNMFALFRFGITAETATKRWQYLIIYFGSGLVGNLGSLYFSDPITYSLGASGAIFGVLAAAMIGQRKLSADNIAIAGVFIALYLYSSMAPGVDSWAHAFGAVAGLVLMLIFRGSREPTKKATKKSAKTAKSDEVEVEN